VEFGELGTMFLWHLVVSDLEGVRIDNLRLGFASLFGVMPTVMRLMMVGSA
jgi:hypothetical protein